MKRRHGVWFILLCLFAMMLNVQVVAAQIDNRTEILIFHSYSPDYEWTQTEQAGIDQVFKPLTNQYKMRIEYLDSNHSSSLLDGLLLKKLYQEKFANSHFKVILVSDNAAFDFLRQFRDDLFPGVPVVFCGINGYEQTMIEGLQGFTGIAEDNDFLGLFHVIAQLHPSVKHIVIYGVPEDASSAANLVLIRKLLPDFYLDIKVDIRELPHLDACLADAKTLADDTVILMVAACIRQLVRESICSAPMKLCRKPLLFQSIQPGISG